jgi:antirestriction protein
MMSTETAPRVAITCLASYNAGRLIYEWVDATDLDELNEARDRVAAAAVEAAKAAGEYPIYFGDPEEFFLSDYEGFGDAIGEYTPFEQVAALGAAIEEHGEAFLAFLHLGRHGDDTDMDDLVLDFEDKYRGEWDSEEEFAQDHVAEVGWSGVPAHELVMRGAWGDETKVNVFEELSSYLDWEAIARDLFINDFTMVDGHVFFDH